MFKGPTPWLFVLTLVLAGWLGTVYYEDLVQLAQASANSLPKPLPSASVEGWVNTNSPPTTADLKGKWVLVDHWATWCGPCIQSMPEMVQLNREWKPRGVFIIGITPETSEAVPAIEKVIESFPGFEWPVAYGGEQAQQLAGISAYPTVQLYSPDGKLAWEGHPVELRQALNEHVGGSKPMASVN